MKVIAFYLPQFHEIEENNYWWDKGFTEWTNMKRCKPLFAEHYQPRIPLNNNYYDLLNLDNICWQVNLAKQYGLYGFCVYHYWFEGHLLLQRPMELYLGNRDLDFPFCFCWANENWVKNWDVVSGKDILIRQGYGNELIWKNHFNYLYPFFKDTRYIRVNGKPLLVIYRPELISHLKDMLVLWDCLAREKGLEGIAFAAQQRFYNISKDENGDLFDFQIEYQPAFIRDRLIKHCYQKNGVHCVDYDDAWREILKYGPIHSKSIPGAFVDWDNTPRKGANGVVFSGATPQKFQKYFLEQLKRMKNVYKKDMIFLFAWNEWSEGGYLEPDEKMQYEYLNAVRNAINVYGG